MSVLNAAECKAKILERGTGQPCAVPHWEMVITLAACRRTLSSRQCWKSEAADCGVGTMVREWNATAQSHGSSFVNIWLMQWHDWNNHSLLQWDEVLGKMHQVTLLIFCPQGNFSYVGMVWQWNKVTASDLYVYPATLTAFSCIVGSRLWQSALAELSVWYN